ncbi:hypothetical protein BGZ67_006288 [Mortierella alpina]|nr:hypothetical protein BGZ67_006288 [Mortierella alpina]
MTLSSLSLAPAPTNNGLNNNNNTYNASSGHFQGREGSKTGATGRDLKRSNSMTTSNSSPGPRTEGLSLIRNEDGTIMVYNPLTESMTFRCELCPGESFGRIHDLKRHQTSKHQEMTWPYALLRHYTVKAARDDGLHPASHEVERLLAARARAKMLY